MDYLIEKYKNRLPKSYLIFISENKRFYGYLDDKHGYIALWDINELQESWSALEIQDNLGENWFPIGSNGGGEMIVINLASSDKELCFIPYIGMKEENADYYCDDFSELYEAITRNTLE